MCACAIKNFSVESAAITAVLDLIGLTKSFIGEVEHKGGRQSNREFMGDLEDQCFGDNTVSVLILPLLTPNDLIYMNEKTNFYQACNIAVHFHINLNSVLFEICVRP